MHMTSKCFVTHLEVIKPPACVLDVRAYPKASVE
jgi:hypothetical protein